MKIRMWDEKKTSYLSQCKCSIAFICRPVESTSYFDTMLTKSYLNHSFYIHPIFVIQLFTSNFSHFVTIRYARTLTYVTPIIRQELSLHKPKHQINSAKPASSSIFTNLYIII